MSIKIPDYCTNPKNYRLDARKTQLWAAYLEYDKPGAVAANANLADPVTAGTLSSWCSQWKKWKARRRK